ncbi:MAG: UDP-N-acetylglucosamine 2-epimerase (non-hydrolyzing) [Crocinitomicaceae bacterium]
MYKVATIIGARPQFIKAAPVSKEFLKSPFFEEILIHTGQHYDQNMSQVFFDELGIPRENYNLKVGSSSQTIMTANMMIKMEEIFDQEQPDCILLYGDTNSTLAAALVGAKKHIPVAHVEAGIRSKRKNRPEEINRIVTDHVSTILFPPTFEGEQSLKEEGIREVANEQISNNNPIIQNVGDVMYDNFLQLSGSIDQRLSILEEYGVQKGNYILLTIHRPLNTDNLDKLLDILSTVEKLANDYQIPFLFPIHPRTRKCLDDDYLKDLHERLIENKNIIIINPVSFIEMMVLQKYCKMVFTDSGGVQKEAAFCKKPCVVLLETTPWKELVRSGILEETGSDPSKIEDAFSNFLNGSDDFEIPKIFGNGDASQKIVTQIKEFLDQFQSYKNDIKFQ